MGTQSLIRIRDEQVEAIKRQAEAEYPNECCGLLIGTIADEGHTRVVSEIYPVKNSWEGSQRDRMLIAPLDYARAERESLKKGLGVVGDYHSHPDHPAVPSTFDLEHSPWPMMSYIVVSVRDGQADEVRSWEIAEDRSQFFEEEIVKGS
jgi:proteasome lid subunit RPN8/RPN11